jgi:hypothetical protein
MVPEKMVDTADPDLITIRSKDEWKSPEVVKRKKPSEEEVQSLQREDDKESSETKSSKHRHDEFVWALKNELTATLEAIAKRFKHMRNAGIPIHLLIGRRDPDISSCYWLWPWNESKYKQQRFSANLEVIAHHIDVLSIMYDLRNPLDPDRLAALESVSSEIEQRATCPLRTCPWEGASDERCPFHRADANDHSRPQVNKSITVMRQLITNKRTLQRGETPADYAGLNNLSSAGVSPGQNANDHPSDDSDTEYTSGTKKTGHRLARRAVFIREALHWQRFWHAYALEFTSLKVLHVRMPRSLDMVGSWYLAKLFNPAVGWHMLTFTDERQHMQTREDLIPTPKPFVLADVYEHKPESRLAPAGRFVRRTWVCDHMIAASKHGFKELERSERKVLKLSEGKLVRGDDSPTLPTKYLQPHFIERPYWGERQFGKFDEETGRVDPGEDVRKGDEREHSKAIRKAKDATAAEKEYLTTLGLNHKSWADENREPSKYKWHIHNVAGNQYRAELHNLMVHCSKMRARIRSCCTR